MVVPYDSRDAYSQRISTVYSAMQPARYTSVLLGSSFFIDVLVDQVTHHSDVLDLFRFIVNLTR